MAQRLRYYWLLPALALLCLALALYWYAGHQAQPPLTVPPLAASPPPAEATFVGSPACAACHQTAFDHWQASQHARAMAPASPATVLGDFAANPFEYQGITTQFSRSGDDFIVRTDGPDGQLQDYPVQYTFGVDPLQQYLLDLGDGRLQALSVAWDTRPEEQGGQRWFHIYPDEAVTHQHLLHWARPSQNWNFMCADCHVTDYRKGYDPAGNRFQPGWSELGVGCEACHGPGSEHLRWAAGADDLEAYGLTLQLDQRQGLDWYFQLEAVTASPRQPTAEHKEQTLCAQCHSLRSQVSEGFQAGESFFDHYRPELLTDPLYYPDGQQREEVFISASFAQSKMHAAGVTCSDCHDPHSQQLRADGDTLCASCHNADHFDQPSHHFHPTGSSGAQCVNCHMPQTTYMVTDPRRDHQFGIPDPHRSLRLDTPNACVSCHQDQTHAWAAEAVADWYPAGRWQDGHFADVFAAADAGQRHGAMSVQQALGKLLTSEDQPPIIRGSAATRLHPNNQNLDRLRAGLAHHDPLIRQGSLEAFENVTPDQRQSLLPLLTDTERSLRSAAARLLSGSQIPVDYQADFTRALADYEAELALHADRADALNQSALLRLDQGRAGEAESLWGQALQRDPLHTGSRLNLADLLRAQGREAAAQRLLQEGLTLNPEDGLLYYALGLSLVRQQRYDEALAHLQQAYQLRPGDPRMAYVLAVATEPVAPAQALSLLEEAVTQHRHDPDLLWAAASFHDRHGQSAAAKRYLQQLLEHYPEHAAAQRLHQQLND
ncbi:tetratricopeptide repeat protein [Halopseudomonas salegens]|uniref:Doubled CXXCH domain-containing protein n=1 Tax=Halopseudomonas salegens TaxID=1434072 RepID=A0A1H2HHI9_9GAMM|nr:tetratricopeptide repeat protein [Halopseudomonas salegens]SDU31340.1 doubled CXXCH domain-containing protein [Halopseudomonas salegens]